MDAHAFSDPIPVPDADIPTWEVEVIRLKGNVIVDQLVVNNDTMPPRKGRKKAVVWQLPDDVSQIPRFGEHEKKRLWELFKEQKKQRRRQSKQQQRESGSPPPDEPSPSRTDNMDRRAVADDSTNTNNYSINDGNQDEVDSEQEIIEIEGPRSNSHDENGFIRNGATNNSVSPSSCTDINCRDSPILQKSVHDQTPGPLQSAIVSPQSADKKEMASTTLPPPPPGFAVPAETPYPATQRQAQMPPVTLSRSTSNGSTTLYFVPPLNVPDSSLGMTVVQAFVATIGHGLVDPWLAYYDSSATKSVLVGTAQVTVTASDSRKEQWASIVREGACAWEVTGWTSHENPQASNPAILVVLTGTTRQATGPFAFTLSLVLARDGPGTPISRYCITNDVLTLFKI